MIEIGSCPKCNGDWANPTLNNDGREVVFFVRCGSCGHESVKVDLKPAIKDWNTQHENLR